MQVEFLTFDDANEPLSYSSVVTLKRVVQKKQTDIADLLEAYSIICDEASSLLPPLPPIENELVSDSLPQPLLPPPTYGVGTMRLDESLFYGITADAMPEQLAPLPGRDPSFTDERGNWVDLTNYRPNLITKNRFDDIVGSASIIEPGRIGVKESENYNEDVAETRSNFDIFEWLAERGDYTIATPGNRRQTLLSLEDFYSVPKLGQVDEYGEVTIDFSSALKILDYEQISYRFIWTFS